MSYISSKTHKRGATNLPFGEVSLLVSHKETYTKRKWKLDRQENAGISKHKRDVDAGGERLLTRVV